MNHPEAAGAPPDEGESKTGAPGRPAVGGDQPAPSAAPPPPDRRDDLTRAGHDHEMQLRAPGGSPECSIIRPSAAIARRQADLPPHPGLDRRVPDDRVRRAGHRPGCRGPHQLVDPQVRAHHPPYRRRHPPRPAPAHRPRPQIHRAASTRPHSGWPAALLRSPIKTPTHPARVVRQVTAVTSMTRDGQSTSPTVTGSVLAETYCRR
jgi:hypothetical protein